MTLIVKYYYIKVLLSNMYMYLQYLFFKPGYKLHLFTQEIIHG